jgi:GNAT superfamily N-acetyltransferase
MILGRNRRSGSPPAASECLLADGRCCQVEAVTVVGEELLREIESFYRSLDRELVFFRTRPGDLRKAKCLLLARVEGNLAGWYGIVRRFVGVPCATIIVKEEFQNLGIGMRLHEAGLACARRHLFVFSIVFSQNLGAKRFFPRLGEEMFYDDGRYTFFAVARRRPLRRLFPLFRLLLPLMLKPHFLAMGRRARGQKATRC